MRVGCEWGAGRGGIVVILASLNDCLNIYDKSSPLNS